MLPWRVTLFKWRPAWQGKSGDLHLDSRLALSWLTGARYVGTSEATRIRDAHRILPEAKGKHKGEFTICTSADGCRSQADRMNDPLDEL
jgi:hypothetical protein